MKKRWLLLAVTVAVLAVAWGASANTRIVILGGNHTHEFDSSKASYVSHGWARDVEQGVPASVVHEEMSGDVFRLVVDGVLIEPTTVHVIRVPAVNNARGVDGWNLAFVFRFPANYFAPGVHEFKGLWFSTDPENPGEYEILVVERWILAY